MATMAFCLNWAKLKLGSQPHNIELLNAELTLRHDATSTFCTSSNIVSTIG